MYQRAHVHIKQMHVKRPAPVDPLCQQLNPTIIDWIRAGNVQLNGFVTHLSLS